MTLKLISSPRPSRRQAICSLGAGFGSIGLASAAAKAFAAEKLSPATGKPTAKVKNVIFVFLNGGLSQVDSFDPKPMLEKYNGMLPPGKLPPTERKTGVLMKSPFAFSRHGKSGLPVSELFPHLAGMVDDLCVVRSMTTPIPNHEPSLVMMNTGHTQAGRPSMGSWLSYGLGSMNQNLPGFIVLSPARPSVVGAPLYSNGFLPASHQGVFIPTKLDDPRAAISYLRGKQTQQPQQEREVELIKKLGQLQMAKQEVADPDLEAGLGALETAFRMQTEAPDAFDLSRESAATHAAYGDSPFARGCMLSRRLVERGVRIVQLYFGNGNPWDHHDDIQFHRKHAKTADQPVAALLADLKARGLLDETLVVVGSEFGRTPMTEVGQGGAAGIRAANGRDHNPYGFTMLLAGKAVRGGTAYGATDEIGLHAVEGRMEVHDLHATILHLLGIDHTKLTFRSSGRNYRLTDVAGHVVPGLLA
jgi:uncharacterized protein (DUF1501 family)